MMPGPVNRHLRHGRGSRDGHAPGLPAGLRGRLEAFFAADLGTVRLHLSDAPAALQARGFAIGESVVLDPRHASGETAAGVGLIVHEVAHVLQQRAGRAVAPARGASGPGTVSGLDSARLDGIGPDCIRLDCLGLEAEADRAAAEFLQGGAAFSGRDGRAWPSVPAGAGIMQCQATGALNARYLDRGSLNPPGGPIAFAANNSLNEVCTTRALAFARAKALLGRPVSTAKRTYHWYLNGYVIANGEGQDINGGVVPGAAAAQRTGRYYDFGHGKLIVEHIDDPNSWTAIGGTQVQRGHFHIASYEVASGNQMSMYLLHGPGYNGAPPIVGNQPPVYDWDRRFSFEVNGGATGHHIYYH